MMKISDSPIIIEQKYNANAEQLWQALTNFEQMKQWYFENLPAFKPAVGFETAFVVHNEGRTFTHLWKVLSVRPLKEITYSWKFKEYEGESTSQFLIENETGNKVSLKLVINVLQDFTAGIPEFKIESCLSGWDYFLNEQLRKFLEG